MLRAVIVGYLLGGQNTGTCTCAAVAAPCSPYRGSVRRILDALDIAKPKLIVNFLPSLGAWRWTVPETILVGWPLQKVDMELRSGPRKRLVFLQQGSSVELRGSWLLKRIPSLGG